MPVPGLLICIIYRALKRLSFYTKSTHGIMCNEYICVTVIFFILIFDFTFFVEFFISFENSIYRIIFRINNKNPNNFNTVVKGYSASKPPKCNLKNNCVLRFWWIYTYLIHLDARQHNMNSEYKFSIKHY